MPHASNYLQAAFERERERDPCIEANSCKTTGRRNVFLVVDQAAPTQMVGNILWCCKETIPTIWDGSWHGFGQGQTVIPARHSSVSACSLLKVAQCFAK